MRRALRIFSGLLLALFCLSPLAAVSASEPAKPDAFEAALKDLCDRRVVLLGENAHGDGRTLEFKVAMVQALVDRCRFSTILFEANHYDFMALTRTADQGGRVEPRMIDAAIGGVWNRTREIQPLAPFLASRLAERRIRLGGLDDQLGSYGALYANDKLPDDVTGYLPFERRKVCREALRREIYADYGSADGRTSQIQDTLLACLEEARSRLAGAEPRKARRAFYQEALRAMTRAVRRGALSGDAITRDRDAAMYETYAWYRRTDGERAKTIVWAANVHTVRDARAFGAPAAEDLLGGRIARREGADAFSLGFSAGGGSYRRSRDRTQPIAPAPAGSLEATLLASAEADAIYADRRQLRALGKVPAAMSYHTPRPYDWSLGFDGVVVFQQERPTTNK
ncbi:MAG: erythromycin esterase family protein [Caulobacter sp.]